MNCVHRWLIDTPNGHPQVVGRCSACGAQRLFNAGANEVGRAWATENGAIVGLGDYRDKRGDKERARRAPKERR